MINEYGLLFSKASVLKFASKVIALGRVDGLSQV